VLAKRYRATRAKPCIVWLDHSVSKGEDAPSAWLDRLAGPAPTPADSQRASATAPSDAHTNLRPKNLSGHPVRNAVATETEIPAPDFVLRNGRNGRTVAGQFSETTMLYVIIAILAFMVACSVAVWLLLRANGR
jgi:hypothetical protein